MRQVDMTVTVKEAREVSASFCPFCGSEKTSGIVHFLDKSVLFYCCYEQQELCADFWYAADEVEVKFWG